jgi:hypothetical protein
MAIARPANTYDLTQLLDAIERAAKNPQCEPPARLQTIRSITAQFRARHITGVNAQTAREVAGSIDEPGPQIGLQDDTDAAAYGLAATV